MWKRVMLCKGMGVHMYELEDTIMYIIATGFQHIIGQPEEYSFLCVKENAYGTPHPVEYLTTKQLSDKYGIKI